MSPTLIQVALVVTPIVVLVANIVGILWWWRKRHQAKLAQQWDAVRQHLSNEALAEPNHLIQDDLFEFRKVHQHAWKAAVLSGRLNPNDILRIFRREHYRLIAADHTTD